MTIAEIKARNKQAGFHFFASPTMRFFNSRILPTVYAEKYFITSEQYSLGHARRYTLRRADPNGMITTIGDFSSYPTLGDAKAALKAIIRKEQSS